jgi:threonine dehydratase
MRKGSAYHAHRLEIPAVIVMPRFTPTVKVERTRSHRAEVVLHGENFDASQAHALTVAAARGLTMVHPYDDEKIIAGRARWGSRCWLHGRSSKP